MTTTLYCLLADWFESQTRGPGSLFRDHPQNDRCDSAGQSRRPWGARGFWSQFHSHPSDTFIHMLHSFQSQAIVERFERFIAVNPDVKIIDPFDSLRQLLDRYKTYSTISNSDFNRDGNVFLVHSCIVFHSSNSSVFFNDFENWELNILCRCRWSFRAAICRLGQQRRGGEYSQAARGRRAIPFRWVLNHSTRSTLFLFFCFYFYFFMKIFHYFFYF